MFSRFVTLLPIAALATVVAAVPNGGGGTSCSTGSDYCCTQQFSGTQYFTGIIGGLLTIVPGLNIPLGLTCDPITALGVSSASACSVQGACCTDSNQIGLVNIQCTPVAVNT